MSKNKKHISLQASDTELVRVLEDLISALIRKGIINWTDLPPKAVEKLSKRSEARKKGADLSSLVGKKDEGIL